MIIITIIHDVITTDGLIETRPTLFKADDDDARHMLMEIKKKLKKTSVQVMDVVLFFLLVFFLFSWRQFQ